MIYASFNCQTIILGGLFLMIILPPLHLLFLFSVMYLEKLKNKIN